MDLQTYILAKKFVQQTAVGGGAIKGSPCVVESIKTDQDETGRVVGNKITLAWYNLDGTKETWAFYVQNGAKGVKGDKGDKGDQGIQGAQGIRGEAGRNGTNGVNATVDVASLDNGYDVTFTDVNGSNTITLRNGADGRDGKDGKSFSIARGYATVADLLVDHPTGQSGDAYLVGTDNPDVYLWTPETSQWTNIGKISGVVGPKGDKGDKGDRGERGVQGVKGDAITSAEVSNGNLLLHVTDASGNDVETINAGSIAGPQGAKGDKGDKGDTGVGIANARLDTNEHLIIVLEDNTEIDAGHVETANNIYERGYIVGQTPFASDWLSEVSGSTDPNDMITPDSNVLYTICSQGDYENILVRWNGGRYVQVGGTKDAVKSLNGATNLWVGTNQELQSVTRDDNTIYITYDNGKIYRGNSIVVEMSVYVSNVEVNQDGELVITYSDSTQQNPHVVNLGAVGGGNTAVDAILDGTSTNAIQNKAVYDEFQTVKSDIQQQNTAINNINSAIGSANVNITNLQNSAHTHGNIDTLNRFGSIFNGDTLTYNGEVISINDATRVYKNPTLPLYVNKYRPAAGRTTNTAQIKNTAVVVYTNNTDATQWISSDSYMQASYHGSEDFLTYVKVDNESVIELSDSGVHTVPVDVEIPAGKSITITMQDNVDYVDWTFIIRRHEAPDEHYIYFLTGQDNYGSVYAYSSETQQYYPLGENNVVTGSTINGVEVPIVNKKSVMNISGDGNVSVVTDQSTGALTIKNIRDVWVGTFEEYDAIEHDPNLHYIITDTGMSVYKRRIFKTAVNVNHNEFDSTATISDDKTTATFVIMYDRYNPPHVMMTLNYPATPGATYDISYDAHIEIAPAPGTDGPVSFNNNDCTWSVNDGATGSELINGTFNGENILTEGQSQSFDVTGISGTFTANGTELKLYVNFDCVNRNAYSTTVVISNVTITRHVETNN